MNFETLRIIDANLNRAREGLRVMEEYCRLILEDTVLCERAKRARHELAAITNEFETEKLLDARDIRGDVGTQVSTEDEFSRSCPADVATAAAKRVGESLRCIEEYGKIISNKTAAGVEELRYKTYELEQDMFVGGHHRARLRQACLHVLITASLCEGPWLTVCERTLQGGADILQLREKSLSDRELLARARALRELTRAYNALLVINDRPDITRLSEADGVHLGQTDFTVSDARQIVGTQILVGKSTHSVAEAESALMEGADYIGVGPMFASDTKPELAEKGLGLLCSITAKAQPQEMIPIVAIGGITAENISAVMQAGNRMFALQAAVCRGVIAANDPAAAAKGLVNKINTFRNECRRKP